MTKMVRIENADNSDHKVVVETWGKGMDGQPDQKLSEQFLESPTMMCEGLVYQGQYLVVREAD